ncbi:hypothetical protein P3S68_003705 [Capsicum galapagoense]
MSDMQKGLDLTVKELLPGCEEKKCARHIFENWSKDWRGLQRMMAFESVIEELLKLNSGRIWMHYLGLVRTLLPIYFTMIKSIGARFILIVKSSVIL